MIKKAIVLILLSLMLMAVPVVAQTNDNECKFSDVMIVMDRSGSMAGDRLTDAKSAANTFVGLLDLDALKDMAGVASFASSSSLDQVLTATEASVNAAINGLVANGLTCISCGLDTAQTELAANGRNDTNQVIVLLSDGAPNVPANAEAVAKASATAAKNAGTIIFTIGIGTADPDLMEDIASDPSFFSEGDEDDLDDIYAEIAGRLCGGPFCGNGQVDDGEQCDDGNNENGDGCSFDCQVEDDEPFCGDGNVDQNEQCDDGNNQDGDGCSATCEEEINEVPEFGVIASLFVLAAAGLFIYKKRN